MASAMQQVVVVWEWENSHRRWRPYSPQVVQLLERAFSKGLKSVFLGDAEPLLSNFSVNITTLRQLCDSSDRELVVRRQFYLPSSPAGRGAVWQWSGDTPGEWHSYDMDVQCLVEAVWSLGEQTVDVSNVFAHLPYIINFCNLTQVKKTSGFVRQIRRAQQAAYPLTKVPADEFVFQPPAIEEIRRPPATSKKKEKDKKRKDSSGTKKLMKQLTRLSSRIADSLDPDSSPAASRQPSRRESADSAATAVSRASAVSARLAGGGSTRLPAAAGRPPARPPDGRRLSVATISTYISQSSHSSGRSLCLMDTSYREDEVTLEQLLLMYTSVVLPAAGCLCCICRYQLAERSAYGDDLVIQLNGCGHAIHLDCLRAMVETTNQVQYLQCPACQAIYGRKIGKQPPGRMSTRRLPIPLPGHDCDTIEISYMISPGIQGPEHPHPGRPYKVRGFPRICYLPSNPQGRKVLRLLEEAWRRRLIFTVGPSHTTGEEDCVTWNGIHHKTELHGNSGGHGYPDPGYLERVTDELRRQGVE
ncbi:probable E3 ubiquitin-protein ligase DTX2 [Amphibalanus amphitrite]|uniref:probable E3 ubiquitin-protein ligase DTX2 n=1 Tax=Amphibalanus amphitrite TaxID=1232801 RepID=UPI001C91DE01|nr:probable E3 ubiquitin-protein ligase DTX2 [Amphibalanus amphitrite]